MDLTGYLISAGYLKTPAIIEAFRKIHRRDFLPENMPQKDLLAKTDNAIPIGCGQTISQPAVVAFMLELLNPLPGQKVMDIGYGSGWTTALLASVVSSNKARGKIIAIELIPELARSGRANIEKYGYVKRGVVECITGDASLGFEKGKPFDRILSSAAADGVPEIWKKELGKGGIIVSPVRNSIVKTIKVGANDFVDEIYYGYEFVPLIKAEPAA